MITTVSGPAKRRVVAAAAFGLLLVPAMAGAAQPWSGEAAIAGPSAPRLAPTWTEQGATVPRITSGSGGPQVATWPTTSPVDGRGTQVLAALDAGRTVRVRTSTTAVDSVRYSRYRTLHLDAKAIGSKVQLGSRLGSADLSTFGSALPFGGPRTILGLPVMAVNAHGAAVAAWRHVTSKGDEIQVVIKPAGERFGSIHTVKTTRVSASASVAVGIDESGRAVIAYALTSPAQIAARVIDTGREQISSQSAIVAPANAAASAPVQLAVGASQTTPGRPIVVAWDDYRASEDASSVSVAAATIAPGGARLGAAHTLDAGATAGYPRGPVLAAVDQAGRPLVAWSALPAVAAGTSLDQTMTPTVPMVAQAGTDGTFAAPQQLDTAGTIGSMVTAGAGVQIGYTREGLTGQPTSEAVALRGPEPPFAAAEEILAQPAMDPPGAAPAYPAGLQPPGLGVGPQGTLIAVYTNVAPSDPAKSTTLVSLRPAP